MKSIFAVVFFFGLLVVTIGYSAPPELTKVLEAFEKEVGDLSSDAIYDKLNGKYFAGIVAAREAAQSRGDLETAVELAQEEEVIKTSGKPDLSSDPDSAELKRLRSIYDKEKLRIQSGIEVHFERLKEKYGENLTLLVQELTRAGRIDDAIQARDALVETRGKTWDEWGRANPIDIAAPKTGKRVGRLRGFGRLYDMPKGDSIDFERFREREDFVELAGNHIRLMMRTANGDVFSSDGEKVGSRAARIFPYGYVDVDGKFHGIRCRTTPNELPLIKGMADAYKRILAVSDSGKVYAWGEYYTAGTGERRLPGNVSSGIKQVAAYKEKDFALTESGEVIVWNLSGLLPTPTSLQSGVKWISTSRTNYPFVLKDDQLLYSLSGGRSTTWTEKAKHVISRGQAVAILDMDSVWHIRTRENFRGSEKEVLEVVLNRPETIDVNFFLDNGQWTGPKRSSYAVWIEDPGAAELDVEKPETLPDVTDTPRGSNSGFFGIEIK